MPPDLVDAIARLADYRDRAAVAQPERLWSQVAQNSLPGVICWMVDADGVVTLSVGHGFEALDIGERQAEGTRIGEWTRASMDLVADVRRDGHVLRVIRETEGPAAGQIFVSSGALHPNGDVVIMTLHASAIDQGRELLAELFLEATDGV